MRKTDLSEHLLTNIDAKEISSFFSAREAGGACDLSLVVVIETNKRRPAGKTISFAVIRTPMVWNETHQTRQVRIKR